MIVTVTGTRAGLSNDQYDWLFEYISHQHIDILIHGAAKGVDSEVHNLAYNILKHIYPADDVPSNLSNLNLTNSKVLPSGKALERNRTMVDAGDILLGFPQFDYEELRSGTWAAIRYARKINKPRVIVYRNGYLGQ